MREAHVFENVHDNRKSPKNNELTIFFLNSLQKMITPATKKAPPTKPSSVITPDKVITNPYRRHQQQHILKKRQAKVSKSSNPRRGLSFVPVTQDEDFEIFKESAASLPTPIIPSKGQEIIVIHSDDSEEEGVEEKDDRITGAERDRVGKGGQNCYSDVVVKTEFQDYFEGLTAEDLDCPIPSNGVRCQDGGLLPVHGQVTNIAGNIVAASYVDRTYNTQTGLTAAANNVRDHTLHPVPPLPTAAALPTLTTTLSFVEGTLGYDNLCVLRDVAQNLSSFHPSIHARVPHDLAANVKIARGTEEVEEYGIGNLVNPVQDLLTPLTQMLFGSVFESAGVTRISDAGMMVAKNSRGEPCTTSAPFHLVFISIPAVDKKPSSVNNVDQREFLDTGNYNPNFWKNHVECRSQANGNVTSWLNLSVKVPECLLGTTQRISHAEGLASLTNIGPVIGNDWMYMTLYGAYCHSFRFFMTSEVTIRARAFGFRPIFLMTNTLLQQTSWGFQNTRLVCCDKGAVSFLSMIGFWKQHSNNTDDVYLLGFHVDGNHLTSNYLIN